MVQRTQVQIITFIVPNSLQTKHELPYRLGIPSGFVGQTLPIVYFKFQLIDYFVLECAVERLNGLLLSAEL